MTKKMAGYLGLASIFLCMVLMTACGGNSNSGSSGGPNGSKGSNASSAPTTPAGAMIARKASTSTPKKATPTATPKPVVITMSPKPTPTMAVPTQVPAPAPTTPPVVPTTPPVVVSNPGVPAAAAAVLTLINQERAGQNLPALKWNAGLQSSAHQHNLAMAAANTMSHQLPGEAAFGDRERAAGVSWTSAAENIGWGQGDPTQVADGINTSMFNETPQSIGGDGHRLNILSSSSNVIGIDVLVDTTHNKVWLTEDFAHI